jgi:hypothetical protein
MIAGSDFTLPEGATLYGADASDEVKFNEKKLSPKCLAEIESC